MAPVGLAEVPSLYRPSRYWEESLGGVISEGRCGDLGNFSKTRL